MNRTADWPSIAHSDLEMLSNLLTLLKPFYYTVQMLQQEDGVTSSLVYGQLKSLLFHTSNFESNDSAVTAAAQMLHAGLSTRFNSLPIGRNRSNAILLSISHGCKPHYIIAALMDPSQAYLVDLDRNLMMDLLRKEVDSRPNDVPSVLRTTEGMRKNF